VWHAMRVRKKVSHHANGPVCFFLLYDNRAKVRCLHRVIFYDYRQPYIFRGARFYNLLRIWLRRRVFLKCSATIFFVTRVHAYKTSETYVPERE
jgi:hypothetical protein